MLIEYARARPIRAGRETFTGRAALSGELVHIPDVLADPDYDYGEAPRLFDYRAGIGVPLLRAGGVDGVFALMRPQPGAFTPRQIEMARAFADQAVIAIENARLFNEVQAKTKDLEEALQQQTATANVLKVISRSAFDLQAVLTTLAEFGAGAVRRFARDAARARRRRHAPQGPVRQHAGNDRIPRRASYPLGT